MSFSRIGLVLWPVSRERALKELVLQVAEGELGMISCCVGRLASILVTEPAELLQEGPGIDLTVVLGVDTALRSIGVSEGSSSLLLSLMQA